MKQLLIVALLVLAGCTNKETPPLLKPVEPVQVEQPYQVLAWGTGHQDWDKAVYDAIDSLSRTPVMAKIKTPCKVLDTRDCAAQLLSIIAKRESNFKTETKYNETGHLQGVVSRGLFQISKDSANQSAYSCGIVDANDLHKPITNIQCAVKILAYQAAKTGVLIDGAKGGCGAYWSVCRSKDGKSESYKEITKYMSKF